MDTIVFGPLIIPRYTAKYYGDVCGKCRRTLRSGDQYGWMNDAPRCGACCDAAERES